MWKFVENKRNKKDSTVVVFRHGARAPTASCLKCFQGTPIATAWREEAIGQLSETGKEQSRALGRHLAATAVPKASGNIGSALWLSSDKPRTLASGKLCIEGFQKSLSHLQAQTLDMTRLGSPKEFEQPGLIFMPWYADEGFRELARQLKKGKDERFRLKAEEEKEFLQRMQEYMSDEFALKGLADALFRMTFFYEILECEDHWQQDDKKSSFSAQINGADAKKIRELAKWVWNYQYFELEAGRKLGNALLKEILDNAKEHKLTFVSAHDFTILILLSSLGVQSHPEQLMNFSSYLRINIRCKGPASTVRKLTLNADPFQGENKAILLSNREVQVNR